MIDPGVIQERLNREPFTPFRIRMADGKHYDVTNADLVVPMDTVLFIAMPKDRFKFLSYQNMTSLESSDVAA